MGVAPFHLIINTNGVRNISLCQYAVAAGAGAAAASAAAAEQHGHPCPRRDQAKSLAILSYLKHNWVILNLSR